MAHGPNGGYEPWPHLRLVGHKGGGNPVPANGPVRLSIGWGKYTQAHGFAVDLILELSPSGGKAEVVFFSPDGTTPQVPEWVREAAERARGLLGEKAPMTMRAKTSPGWHLSNAGDLLSE